MEDLCPDISQQKNDLDVFDIAMSPLILD